MWERFYSVVQLWARDARYDSYETACIRVLCHILLSFANFFILPKTVATVQLSRIIVLYKTFLPNATERFTRYTLIINLT